jgi:hypothetical protein
MAKEDEHKGPCPANDNGSHSGEPLDPRIRRIAEAIHPGRTSSQLRPCLGFRYTQYRAIVGAGHVL